MGGMFWTFSGTGVQVGVQLLAIMTLGRLLTPTESGLMGAASVVIGFSQIVSQVGVGPAILQRHDLEPVHVRVAVTLSLVFGLVLGAVVFLGAPAIAEGSRSKERYFSDRTVQSQWDVGDQPPEL
jgi:teichuronic acid exporter